MEQEPPKAFVTPALILGLICSVGFLSATINGYNSALLDGLLQNNDFKQFFHGSNAGLWVGIISFLYKIGQVTATPFIGPCIDTWGRRKGIFVGLVIVILGAIIGGTTSSTRDMKQFMVSRFILGFGGHIVACGGPIYVVEMCHPAYRGSVTALCNTSWYVVPRNDQYMAESYQVHWNNNRKRRRSWLVEPYRQPDLAGAGIASAPFPLSYVFRYTITARESSLALCQ